MASNIRRRRWPLFFEPRRRFKKKILKIMKMLRAWLRYAARAAVSIAKGRGIRAVLEYAAAVGAWVKKAGRGVRLNYFMRPLQTAVKRAGRAASLMYWTISRTAAFKRLAPAPTLSYWPRGPDPIFYREKADRPRLYYQAYSPYIEAEKGLANQPHITYPASADSVVVGHLPEVAVYFINRYDPYYRTFIVCIDKDWMTQECNSTTYDWGIYMRIRMHGAVVSPYLKFKRKLMAVVVTNPFYAYIVEFRTRSGSLVKRCDFVDGGNPCYLYIEELMRFAGVM
jgi:hypothetical protein